MTHDELLAICDNYSFKDSTEPVKALRAVVELHYQQNEGGYCDVCPDYEYPCRTIQAIQKELE